MNTWQIQDAKAHFCELVKKATNQGPQSVTVRGKPTVVVISQAELTKLQSKPKPSLVEFLHNSPLYGAKLKIERDKSLCRKNEFEL